MTISNLIPIKDAPNHIPFAEKTLRNWRSDGVYPQLFIKLGGKVFIDLDEYEKLVQVQKDKANDMRKRFNLD